MEERIVTLPDEYESLFLRELRRRLATREERSHVLDLGRPSGDNLQFFSSLNCKITISDFFESLTAEGVAARRRPEHFSEACAKLLSFPDQTRFDLVLAWDLLNYLSLDEIGIVMHHLRGFCRDGARLMALVSIYQRIPDQPFRCFSFDEGRVRYESTSAVQRESPRHREPDLLAQLGGFEVETSLLLKGGMREYGFVLSEGA